MNLFEDKYEDKSKLHQKYKIINDLPYHKKLLSRMADGFYDRDNKIVKEFQTTFHSSYWELYLFSVFKHLNFNFIEGHNRPDFIINYKNDNILIEATVSNIKKEGVPETSRNMDNYINLFKPPFMQENFEHELNESIVRYSNSITQKRDIYTNNYKKCSWVKESDSYVIALSSYSQIDYGREYIYGILALLFGVYFDHKTMSYNIKDHIIKNNSNSKIPLGLFFNKDFEEISAIIFSSSTTIGKLTSMVLSTDETFNDNVVYTLYNDLDDDKTPYKVTKPSINNQEALQDGLFVLHNPNAKNPLDIDVFNDRAITQIFINEDMELQFIGNLCPTILRLDIPVQLESRFANIIFSFTKMYNDFMANE